MAATLKLIGVECQFSKGKWSSGDKDLLPILESSTSELIIPPVPSVENYVVKAVAEELGGEVITLNKVSGQDADVLY